MKSKAIRFLSVALLLAVLCTATDSFAAKRKKPTPIDPKLKKVCQKITGLGYRQLYKFESSGHLAGTMWAGTCSFIVGLGAWAPSGNRLPIFNKKGKLIGVFTNWARGYPGDGVSVYGARFYTTGYSCAGIAAAAQKGTRSAMGFIGIGNKTCIQINNLYGREGGV